MRQTLLTNNQLLFLKKEKEFLANALETLKGFNLPADAITNLRRAIEQLDELFLVVVVGEFNAGKSAIINALLGERVLLEGVTPTTARVTLLRWGDQIAEQVVDEGFAIVTHPLPLLRELNIVDSPGTNAIDRRHERLTDEYVPRSDLVLFITSADRPMTESERQFLQKIISWGKKVTLIINKVDILENNQAVNEVRAFVQENARNILGSDPEIFTLSARLAQKAVLTADPAEAQRLKVESGIDALEQYITQTLDDRARLELKLRNPLGVAVNLQQQALKINQEQMEDLAEDSQLAGSLESMIQTYEKELTSEVPPRLAEVENVLNQFELRGQAFFDNTLRLANIANLTRSEKIKDKFRQEVMGDLNLEIEEKVRNLIDWLVDKDLHVWYQVAGALERRQAQSQKQMPSGGQSPQASKRKELIESVGAAIRSIISSYDREKEAEELGAFVTDSVAQTALFEVGAVGLGALVATALFSSAMDVTGIVAASTLAVLGLFVIPFKRKQAKENFKAKMDQLRQSLMRTLSSTFSGEFEAALKRLRDNVSPYTDYVHAEQARVDSDKVLVDRMKQDLEDMLRQVDLVM